MCKNKYMRYLLIILGITFIEPSFANDNFELDDRIVCEITTRKFDRDIERCEKGDILSIFVNGGKGFDVPNAIARACHIENNDMVVTLGEGQSFIVCIYRGKLREHKNW